MTASTTTPRRPPRSTRPLDPAWHPIFENNRTVPLSREDTFDLHLILLVQSFCPLKDGQGSVRKVVDTAGTVVASYDYDAWGNVLGQDQPSGWIFNHRAFGEVLDPNLGMTYLRARWMDPGTGRFLGRDSLGGTSFDPPSLHRYTYASSDPVNKFDPSGDLVVDGTDLDVLREQLSTIGGVGDGAYSHPGVKAATTEDVLWGQINLARGAIYSTYTQVHIRLNHGGETTPSSMLLHFEGFGKILTASHDKAPPGKSANDQGTYGRFCDGSFDGDAPNGCTRNKPLIFISAENLSHPHAKPFGGGVPDRVGTSMTSLGSTIHTIFHELLHQYWAYGGSESYDHEEDARVLRETVCKAQGGCY